jgi:hypothetical protein
MTDREAVRLTIADTAGTIFTDAEIDWFLEKENDDVDIAAARACEALAASATLVAKAQASGQFSTDKKGIPDYYLALAARLRANAAEVAGGIAAPAYGTAEIRIEPNSDDYA